MLLYVITKKTLMLLDNTIDICLYVYIYTYIHIYMYIYLYIYIHIFIYTHIKIHKFTTNEDLILK